MTRKPRHLQPRSAWQVAQRANSAAVNAPIDPRPIPFSACAGTILKALRPDRWVGCTKLPAPKGNPELLAKLMADPECGYEEQE